MLVKSVAVSLPMLLLFGCQNPVKRVSGMSGNISQCRPETAQSPLPSPSPMPAQTPVPASMPSPSPSPSPSASPSSVPATASSIPGKALIGYWHNFDNGSGFLTLKQASDNAPQWDVIQVAFAESDPSQKMIFEPYKYSDAAAFNADIDYLHSKGKTVILSIGGANAHVRLDDAAKKEAFVSSMKKLLDTYHFDGIDLDLEGGSVTLDAGDTDFMNPKTPAVVNLIAAVRELYAHKNNKMILTMAPETYYVQVASVAYAGAAGAYIPVIQGLRDIMTFIHVQDYNTGGISGLDGKNYSPGTADFHVAMNDMLLAGFPVGGPTGKVFPGLRPDQVAIGLPGDKNSAGSGFTSNEEVQKAMTYLTTGKSFGGQYKLANPAGYAGFRGLMAWSINWDAHSGYAFSKSHGPYLKSMSGYGLKLTGESAANVIPYSLANVDCNNLPSQSAPAPAPGSNPTPVQAPAPASPPASAPVPAPNNGGAETAGIPKRIMSGYWHNFENGSGFIKLRDVSKDWDFINVSFAEPKDGSMVMAFATYTAGPKGYASIQEFKDDIALVQKRGQKVIISIGGEKGHVLLDDDAKTNNFITSMNKIIDEFGFDGFDIDFEGQSLHLDPNDYGHNYELGADPEMKNMPKTPVLANLIKAIRALHKHTEQKGKKFILTMAPETFFVQVGHSNYGAVGNGDSRTGAYLPVIDSVRDILTLLQVQNYNSGPVMGLDGQYHSMGSADFHIACLQMLVEGFNIANSTDSKLKFKALRPDQVAIGVPSTGSAGNGYVSNEEIHKALNCIEKGVGCTVKLANPNGYPGLRGIMTWSINWDVFTNSAFSGPNRKFLDSL